MGFSQYKGISVLAETTVDNKIADVTFELIGVAEDLLCQLKDENVSVILLCGDSDSDSLTRKLVKAGVQHIILVPNKNLQDYNTEHYTKAVCEVIERKKPSILLLPATIKGRDLAPRISARLDTGLTADCTRLSIGKDFLLEATRPAYGGSLMATILCPEKRPQMVTVRPRVFTKPTQIPAENPTIEQVDVQLSQSDEKVKVLDFLINTKILSKGVEHADVIVAGGRGMMSSQGFLLLERLANAFDGTVGASRGAVDAGWRPVEDQIGQTGKTVTPKLYIACGISGTVQHVAGITSAECIVAINSDPEAPIFSVATYGIVTDLFEFVPLLTDCLEKILTPV